jgi:hypothetical protein
MRPEAKDIAVPPFPAGIEWVGAEPQPVERICARGPLLVHFIDAAHFSSARTLPYLNEWHERYGPLGLTLVGINSPRFPFTADATKLAGALARLGVGFPVAVDADYRAWHDYGCEGWPSLFLWSRGGALRWFHFGEGEYAATERAIQDELRAVSPTLELPSPMPPLRPSDAPDALVAQPSPEVLPGGSISEPWLAARDDAALELDYAAGGVWASVDGEGTLSLSLDGGAAKDDTTVNASGAYELVAHDLHESHHLSIAASPGLAVYSIGFAAGLPPTG